MAKLQSQLQFEKQSKLPGEIQKLEAEIAADKERMKQLKKV